MTPGEVPNETAVRMLQTVVGVPVDGRMGTITVSAANAMQPAELVGGSLYWIFGHRLVGRSPLLGFARSDDGRWVIRLEPRLIATVPVPRRAHQGWRYLAQEDTPADLLAGTTADEDAMPGELAGELARLGLI